MEKWDKGIQMLQEPEPVDKDLLDKLALIQDYNEHRAGHVHLLSTKLHTGKWGAKALELVKDPVTGAYGLPQDKEPTE